MEFLIVVGMAVTWLCLGPFTCETERAYGRLAEMRKRRPKDWAGDGDGDGNDSGGDGDVAPNAR